MRLPFSGDDHFFRFRGEFEKEWNEPRKSKKFTKGCRVFDESDETVCQKEKSHQQDRFKASHVGKIPEGSIRNRLDAIGKLASCLT